MVPEQLAQPAQRRGRLRAAVFYGSLPIGFGRLHRHLIQVLRHTIDNSYHQRTIAGHRG
jgi:hypothetical protein